MAIRTIISEPVPERSSARITAKLEDEAGAGIPGGSLTTLTLTLYAAGPGTVINNRNKQNALNANGVTIDASGNLVYQMDPLDNQNIGSDPTERHIALFEWTWSAGAKAGKHEVLLTVVNLGQVP